MIFSTGSGYGLVQPGNKPWAKQMLTEIYVAILRHQGTVSKPIDDQISWWLDRSSTKAIVIDFYIHV